MPLLLVECVGDSVQVQALVVVLAVEWQPVASLAAAVAAGVAAAAAVLLLEHEPVLVLEPGLELGPELGLELGHWHQQSKKRNQLLL